MDAYSLDLRERVCGACDDDEAGETRQEIADRFGVSRSFVQKLLCRRRETGGSIAAKPRAGGARSILSDADRQRVRQLVVERPDATLAELCRSLCKAGGATVSIATMCRTLKALRLPLKKRRCTRASVTRRGFSSYGTRGSGGSPRRTRESWSSWTRAGPTRR